MQQTLKGKYWIIQARQIHTSPRYQPLHNEYVRDRRQKHIDDILIHVNSIKDHISKSAWRYGKSADKCVRQSTVIEINIELHLNSIDVQG